MVKGHIEGELLAEFIEKCREKFARGLISIVLFGSRARGNAGAYSDYDLLVVVKDLPKGSERDKIALELRRAISRNYYIPIQPYLATLEELQEEPLNPLIYGILVGYRVLYGEKGWEELLSFWRPIIKKTDPELIDEARRWKIAELI